MNPIISVLSVILFAIGAVFSFGAYRIFPAVPKTITLVFLPLLHLGIGTALFLGKPTARPAAFFLAFFYMFLGLLAWNEAGAVIDFIPIVPLIEFIPAQVIRLNTSLLSGLCFFAAPLAVALILSLRSAGFSFEPFLKGRFSWSAPVSVLLAGAFVFSYSLLASSETALFLTGEGRNFFGRPLPPAAAKVISYVEFCVPFIIAFAFLAGEIWAWVLGLVFGVYYWLPFIKGGFALDGLRDFKFLFFGTGWLLTILTLVFCWPFFWRQEEWAERRTAGKRNWFYSILFWVLALGVLVQAGSLLFSGSRAFQIPSPMQTEKSVPPSTTTTTPPFRLEGTSVDSQGSYALINGELVKAGALVDGFRVETIERDGITLAKEGKRYRLGRDGREAVVVDDGFKEL